MDLQTMRKQYTKYQFFLAERHGVIIAQPENHEITRGFHNVAKAVYHMYDFFVQLEVIHRAGDVLTFICDKLIRQNYEDIQK